MVKRVFASVISFDRGGVNITVALLLLRSVTASDRTALEGPAEINRARGVDATLLPGFVFLYHALKVLLLDAMILERAGL